MSRNARIHLLPWLCAWAVSSTGAQSEPARPRQLSARERAVNQAYASGREADFRRAADLLQDELRTARNPGPLHESLGYIYLDRLNEPAAAVPHLEAVMHARPQDGSWRQMLAKAYEGAGHLSQAAAAYQKAAAADAKDVWARYHRGRILAKLGRAREAEAAYAEAYALEPENAYVRIELARLRHARGHDREAIALTEPVTATSGPATADAHALLGDIARRNWGFSRARSEYTIALQQQPENYAAQHGLAELRKAQAPRASLTFYTFEDTEDFQQTGIYANVSALLTGRFGVSAAANQRYFTQGGKERIERFGSSAHVEYRFSRQLIVSAGVSQFQTEHHGSDFGGNAALYVMPSQAVDLSATYQHAEPVDDSYFTALEAFTRNTVAGQLNVRPTRLLTVSGAGSVSSYSDDNTRRWALGTLAYLVSARAAATVKIEYEWLDFTSRQPGYSSPSDYTLLRPVLEFSPQLTSWLKLEIRGELPYVRDERAWGYGLRVGPRFTVSDRLHAGFSYLNYEIPGEQTNWSGEGWKVDFSYRF